MLEKGRKSIDSLRALEDRPVEWVNGVGDLNVDIMSDTLSMCILAGE
jgi:hypothetical protein